MGRGHSWTVEAGGPSPYRCRGWGWACADGPWVLRWPLPLPGELEELGGQGGRSRSPALPLQVPQPLPPSSNLEDDAISSLFAWNVCYFLSFRIQFSLDISA